MDKYISDTVNTEDIKIDIVRNFDEDGNRIQSVKVEHTPTGISVEEIIEEGWLIAYNKCIINIESVIKYKEFKDYYDKRPDKFVEEYMGIKLKLYQKVILKAMDILGK